MPTASLHLALLRGINVGGRHKLPMAALRALFGDHGCTDVRTYIQSGNVVFRPPGQGGRTLAKTLAAAIEAEHGFAVPVVIRTAAQWRELATGNPFLDEGVDPQHLHVFCLADRPAATALRQLDPQRSPGDRFVVRGSDIYLHLPHGVAGTKLTNDWFDRALATRSTGRNWKTVGKLLEMLEGR